MESCVLARVLQIIKKNRRRVTYRCFHYLLPLLRAGDRTNMAGGWRVAADAL